MSEPAQPLSPSTAADQQHQQHQSQQQQQQQQQQQPAPAADGARREFLDFYISYVDRAKKTPLYRLDVSTNVRGFRRSRYVAVERAYIEFERLSRHLRATYPEYIVPTLPAASVDAVGCSIGPGTVGTNSSMSAGEVAALSKAALIENDTLVRNALQTFLARVGAHEVLRRDYELREFVDAPFLFNPTSVSPAALAAAYTDGSDGASPGLHIGQAGSGFMVAGSSARTGRRGGRVAFAGGVPEEEQRFEAMSRCLGAIDARLEVCLNKVTRIARRRLRLAESMRSAGEASEVFAATELDAQLAGALGADGLGGALRLASRAMAQRGEQDAARLGYFFDGMQRVSRDIQDALIRRHRILAEHELATRRTADRRQIVEVVRSQAAIDQARADAAIRELDTARADEAAKKRRADTVMATIPSTLARAEGERVHDWFRMMREHARSQIDSERTLLLSLQKMRSSLQLLRHPPIADESSEENSRAPSESESGSTSSANDSGDDGDSDDEDDNRTAIP